MTAALQNISDSREEGAFDEPRACVIASLAIQLARLPVSPEGRNQ